MTKGRRSTMMVLSALMKMLLWTLPGASLHTRDTFKEAYKHLVEDLNKLDIDLNSSLGCHEIHTSSYFMFNGQFLRSLIVAQHSSTVFSAIALAEILSQTPTDADEPIRTLLRGFIRFNRVLSEAAYVVPVSALPPASKAGRDDKVIIVHAAVRIPSGGMRLAKVDEYLEANTTTLLDWEPRYQKLKAVRDSLIETSKKRDDTTPLEEPLLRGRKRPMAILEKYCELESSSQSNASKRYKEWRIMLGFLANHATKADQSVPVFYISLPLQNIDLNQCDDSPHPKIRGTHGCHNTTCIFSPGGGFEMGHYKCCCQTKNISGAGASQSSFTWLEQQHQYHQLFWQKREQCFDGKDAEDHRLKSEPFPQCETYFEGDYTLRKVLLAVNIICAMAAFALMFVVMTQRKVQDWGARGWALMELFLLGAILLYGIVILEFLQPQTSTCGLILWCRELGFALFYGAVVLKIHRNLFEHRVRKAHHVYIKEKDLLKYLLCIVAFTVIGLVAWTATAVQAAQPTQLNTNGAGTPSVALLSRGATSSGSLYVVCTFFNWNIVWHTIEFALLSYGAYLSYKARNTTWNERRQFAAAVFAEMLVSLITIIIKKNIWLHSSPDTLLLLSFIQVHLTVTFIIALIMATKFYYASLDPSARAHSIVSSGPNKPHPSLAKLRDNLVNGTVDFAEVPIAEMNPEDIRAELKRVYTQLRMYKLTNLYMENPHISKRKGGKKTSSKQTNRRFSIPTVTSKAHNKELKRLEADERSSLAKGTDDDKDSLGSAADLTIQSSPHNIYLSRTALAAAKKLQLDSDLSVRI